MAATQWNFQKPPFAMGNAEPVFYAGIPQQEALARLRFLVHNQRRLGLLLGEPGWGKSLLLTLFADEATDQGWQVARLNLMGLSVREFHWQLAAALHANPRTGDDLHRLAQRLDDQLQQNRFEEQRTIVLLDDADQAGADVLTQLARLVQLPASRVGNLTIVLTAGSIQRLGRHLLDMVELRIDLEPWDDEDTIGYVQLALVAAGADEPIFDDDALAAIHRHTSGVPRLVNRLADYALLAASSAGVPTIDAEIVSAAHQAIARR